MRAPPRASLPDALARAAGCYTAPKAAPTRAKVRRFRQFYDAAGSWSRVERIAARVEAGSEGSDTRFIVTNQRRDMAGERCVGRQAG
jgi:hypothetical protein